MRDELAIEQSVCEQPAVNPEPLCTPFELNPFAFPHPSKPTEPNQSSPNEPNQSGQPIETKSVISPVAPSHDPHPAPADPELKTEN
jgi:hypothetical protein